jgi:hypothetical protein
VTPADAGVFSIFVFSVIVPSRFPACDLRSLPYRLPLFIYDTDFLLYTFYAENRILSTPAHFIIGRWKQDKCFKKTAEFYKIIKFSRF